MAKLTVPRYPVLLCLLPLIVAGQTADSLPAPLQADNVTASRMDSSLVGPLFHNPPVAILNDRPFRFDFFVAFDDTALERVSLLVRKADSLTYREIPLEGQYNRYQHVLPVDELTGSAITYYFVVDRKDYGVWAYPTSPEGAIQPFVIDLVPPTLDFFQKRYYE